MPFLDGWIWFLIWKSRGICSQLTVRSTECHVGETTCRALLKHRTQGQDYFLPTLPQNVTLPNCKQHPAQGQFNQNEPSCFGNLFLCTPYTKLLHKETDFDKSDQKKKSNYNSQINYRGFLLSQIEVYSYSCVEMNLTDSSLTEQPKQQWLCRSMRQPAPPRQGTACAVHGSAGPASSAQGVLL